jgi:hypothetical protein
MELVYTHINPMMAKYAAEMLRQQGINAEMRNEFVTSVAGTGAPCDAWPEVWVADADGPLAIEFLAALASEVKGEPWQCPECHEMNEANFEICWQCHSSDKAPLP